jgi:hypothetical protein
LVTEITVQALPTNPPNDHSSEVLNMKLSLMDFCYIFAGGVAEKPCPFKCISDRYHMPHCYTALEELIYTFGGPWLFGLFLMTLLVLLALVLSVARVKFVGNDELPGPAPTQHGSQIDHSFPFLESLNEVFLVDCFLFLLLNS